MLAERKYSITGMEITVRSNWTPVIDRRLAEYEIMQDIELAVQLRDSSRINAAYSRFSLDADRIELSTSGETTNPLHLRAATECFIYDIFLLMNIAAPGVMNLFAAKFGKHPISLSNNYFALSFLDRQGEKWPRVSSIDLHKVMMWYFNVRSGVSQIPKNKMEKALFSLWHLSETMDNPAAIIWIFYGLETFFDTKPGENRRTLIERIDLLLQPNDQERKLLQTKMKALYDLRSSFVHGGMEVVHPMHDESVDDAVNVKWRKISQACEFGFRLLLCSIQQTIERGWQTPKFKVVMEGTALSD